MTEHRVPSGSPDLTEENIQKLKQLFPEILTDGEKIDFEKLKLIMGEEVEESKEHYQFTWHGKRETIRGAQIPSNGTLKVDKASSKNFDTTENLYIEGDNLEVLKLLQKSYNGKIKMIYIDPPYNTGKDFVYKDNFYDGIDHYLEMTGQKDEEGNRLTTNTDSSGRFHTDWLNMMYPRLKLAKNLLTEDGVVFISIDQAEFANLRQICDQIFGAGNYIGEFIWSGGRKNDSKYISLSHEFILVYVKNEVHLQENKIMWRERKEGLDDIYKIADEFVKSTNNDYHEASSLLKQWYRTLPESHLSLQHKHYSWIDEQGVYFAGDISWPGGGGPIYDILHPITQKPVKIPTRGWLFQKSRMSEMIKQNRVHFGEDETKVPTFKRYLKETDKQVPYSVIYKDGRGAMKRLRELLNGKIFDFPKDEEIIKRLLELVTTENDHVLDFFSGSATTAHAAMQLNAEDGGSRRFIMVQLPEETEEKSEAYKAGYKNICEIGKERIRRAGEKIIEENPEVANTLDIGFKVLKLEKSNIREWNADFDDIERTLETFDEVFIPDAKEIDIVYEIMLKTGLELTLPINSFQVDGKNVYDIAFGNLFICLDDQIDRNIAAAIIEKRKEYEIDTSTVVFKDAGFANNDSEKLNCFEMLKDAGYTDEQLMTI